MEDQEREHARLRWMCRRGMKELDQLLLGFFDARFARLEPEARQCFAELLEWQDPELIALLFGRMAPPDRECADVVRQIRECARF